MSVRRPLPQVTPWNTHYWQGGADGVLRMQRCTACGRIQHPPVPRCALCQADALEKAIAETEQIPLLLTVSDNGPQMRSHSTREFLAGVYIAQRFGRPGTPTDQPWIESHHLIVKQQQQNAEAIVFDAISG